MGAGAATGSSCAREGLRRAAAAPRQTPDSCSGRHCAAGAGAGHAGGARSHRKGPCTVRLASPLSSSSECPPGETARLPCLSAGRAAFSGLANKEPAPHGLALAASRWMGGCGWQEEQLAKRLGPGRDPAQELALSEREQSQETPALAGRPDGGQMTEAKAEPAARHAPWAHPGTFSRPAAHPGSPAGRPSARRSCWCCATSTRQQRLRATCCAPASTAASVTRSCSASGRQLSSYRPWTSWAGARLPSARSTL